MEENQCSSINQPLEMQENMAIDEDDYENLTDWAFEKRHSSGEMMEKRGFSSFLTGSNNWRRAHCRDEPTPACPTSKAEHNPVIISDLLSWPRRRFPLSKGDEDDLEHLPSP